MDKNNNIFHKDIEIPDIVIKKANFAFDKIKEEDYNAKKNEITKKQTGIWKVSAAVCAVTLLIPTVVFASTKIYQYYNTSVSREDKKVEMVLDGNAIEDKNQEDKYIKISADFGKDYTIIKEGLMMHYEHVDGFEAGKNFWYELIKLDKEQKQSIFTYDNKDVEELKINGRKAVYCERNYIEGSQYESETDINKTLYIFLEEYGYYIRMSSLKNLSKEKFIELAEKLQITEVDSKEEASQYYMYSNVNKPYWELIGGLSIGEQDEIDLSNYYRDRKINTNGGTVTVESIEILDSVQALDSLCFREDVEMDQLLDENGKLKTYDRETLGYGNGIDSPYEKVIDTMSINPKLVYITLKYKDVESFWDMEYSVPRLELVYTEGEKMYRAGINYNRPRVMEEIVCNGFPCYFEETKGGEHFNFTDLKDGDITMHIAYIVDEDMMDGMLLDVEPWNCTSPHVYIDISQ